MVRVIVNLFVKVAMEDRLIEYEIGQKFSIACNGMQVYITTAILVLLTCSEWKSGLRYHKVFI